MSSLISVENYDNFCIDIDGVMWNGQEDIKGSSDAVRFLLSLNKKVFFVTNNTLVTREGLQQRFSSLGIALPLDNIYTTGNSILKYLKTNYPNNSKLVVLGMPSLRNLIKDAGYQIIYPPELENPIKDLQSLRDFEVEPGVQAVIVAYDTNFDYFGALYCAACVQNGAKIVGPHRDRFLHIGKPIFPSSGCSIRFVETATGTEADIIGKPNKFMFDLIANENQIEPKRTLMIGDSMESDIVFGINSGIDTALVLTGITSLEKAMNFSFKPTYILDSLSKILK